MAVGICFSYDSDLPSFALSYDYNGYKGKCFLIIFFTSKARPRATYKEKENTSVAVPVKK